MAGWRGIDFTEYVGDSGPGASPQEEFGVDRGRTTKLYDIAWVDRSRAVREFLGFAEVKTLGAAKFISRTVPHHHADFLKVTDGKPFLFATGCAFQGLGVNRALPEGESRMKSIRDTAQYQQARMRVQYETLTYDILTDEEMIAAGSVDSGGRPDESTWKRYCTVLPRPKGRFLGLVGHNFVFDSDNQPIPQPPGRIVPQWDLRVTWHAVPERGVPSILVNPTLQASGSIGAIDAFTGKVNRGTFNGFASGTLLCLVPEIVPHRSPRGERIYDVHFYFEWFPFFHNRVPRVLAGTFGFVRCSTDGNENSDASVNDGKLIYDSSADFALMFRAP